MTITLMHLKYLSLVSQFLNDCTCKQLKHTNTHMKNLIKTLFGIDKVNLNTIKSYHKCESSDLTFEALVASRIV